MNDTIIALQPLADGTPVEGIVGEGHPIGVDVSWCDIQLGVAFQLDELPLIEIGESQISLSDWPAQCPRYVRRSPELFRAVEEMIDIARAWQPHQFTT